MSDEIQIVVVGKDEASGVFENVGGSMGKLGGILKGGLVAGAGIAVAGVAGLTAVIGSSIKEAMAAEEVQAQLAATLKSTGGAAGVTAQMANDLANSFSSMTTFEDDAILSGENMLLTFTNIGKDVFPTATQTMLDMSQALGQDLKSSAMQLGKALNDPVAGMSALQRVGVTFTDAQKQVVQAMVETGNVAGAQKLILGELQKEFGGSAKAAGETFGGQMEILKNQLGNVKESIGSAFLPMLTQLATTLGPVLISAAQGLADWIVNQLVPALQQMWQWFSTYILPVLQQVGQWILTNVVPALQQLWQWIDQYVMPVVRVLAEYFTAVLKVAFEVIGIVWDTVLKPALTALWNFIKATLGPALQWFNDNVLQPWLNLMHNIADWLQKGVEWLKNLHDGLASGLPNPFGPLIDFISNLIGKLKEAIDWWNRLRGASAGGTGTNPGAGAGDASMGDPNPYGTTPHSPTRSAAGAAAGWSVTINISGVAGSPAAVAQAAETGVLRAARAMGYR